MYRVVLACIVLINQFTLASLAYSTPTDPVWIDGVYDLEDDDNSILAATVIDRAPPSAPPEINKMFPVSVGTITLQEVERCDSISLPVSQIRAPPSILLHVAD